MKQLFCMLFAVTMMLSGCGGSPAIPDGGAQSTCSLPEYEDEASFIEALLADPPETFTANESSKEITLYRYISSENYFLTQITQGNVFFTFKYDTQRLIDKRRTRQTYVDGQEIEKLYNSDRIQFYWFIYYDRFPEEERKVKFQEDAAKRNLRKYGDTDYYVSMGVERKNPDVSFEIMWMQDNHVFEVLMPGFAEISEENIADYCRAEAFTVSTNQ